MYHTIESFLVDPKDPGVSVSRLQSQGSTFIRIHGFCYRADGFAQ